MRSRLLRFFGLVLLLLAVSPATEPFATIDIADLFGEPAAPAAASVQPPKTADQPVAAIGSSEAARLTGAEDSEQPRLRRDPLGAPAGTYRQLRV